MARTSSTARGVSVTGKGIEAIRAIGKVYLCRWFRKNTAKNGIFVQVKPRSMFVNECRIRVRYAETDQMGVVYYGNYATYFEVARVEMLRALGLSYAAMEEDGVMLPVLELKTKFIRPAKYDEELTIRTTMRELPQTRIRFEYEVFNPQGQLLNVAETTLVFIDKAKNKPCLAPEALLAALRPHFEAAAVSSEKA